MDYSHSRLGELVELAVDYELVEACNVTKDVVVVTISGLQLTFAKDEARGFLSNLLAGWARSQPAPQVTMAPELRRRSLFTPFPVDSTGSSGLTLASNGGPSVSPENDEAYVDAVLNCAEKLNLIEGFNKDRASHRVTLKTKATTTDMTYYETLEYLTSTILEELRTGNRA
jgi:hypothetical protein